MAMLAEVLALLQREPGELWGVSHRRRAAPARFEAELFTGKPANLPYSGAKG